MPSMVREHQGYRIAIYSPLSHCAVITPPGSNRVIELGDRKPRATVAEGPLVCLERAEATVRELIASSARGPSNGSSEP